MNLTTAQLDRAAGVLVATAAGDALGAGYELGPALPTSTPVTMKGGGPFGFSPSESSRRYVHGNRDRQCDP
ncbi:hypothetical protein [Arthrobacter psychrolactophilus]